MSALDEDIFAQNLVQRCNTTMRRCPRD